MAHDNEHIELPITGMTCASCASRIERKLNKLDGVSAAVNYATEKATVDYDPAAARPEDLLGAVEAAGYQAVLLAAEPAHDGGGHAHHDLGEDETAALHRRLVISAVLSLAVLLMAMVPGAAVRQLAVAFPPARYARRPLGRLAVSRGRVGQRQACDGDHGHAHQRGRARGMAVVGVRAFPRRRRHAGHADAVRAHPRARRRDDRDLPRSRLGRHHAHPARALLRGARQAPRRSRAEGAAGARRQGRQRDR